MSRPRMLDVVVTSRLSREDHAQLNRIAHLEDRSKAYLIRRYIREGIQRDLNPQDRRTQLRP